MTKSTKEYTAILKGRTEQDAKFRGALLREGIECLFSGEFKVAKSILRVYHIAKKRISLQWRKEKRN